MEQEEESREQYIFLAVPLALLLRTRGLPRREDSGPLDVLYGCLLLTFTRPSWLSAVPAAAPLEETSSPRRAARPPAGRPSPSQAETVRCDRYTNAFKNAVWAECRMEMEQGRCVL
ncbi:hypothetical protein PAMP_011037 [Pampus punctatissimus]